MGITKLLHMKAQPRCVYEHLQNAIYYILEEEKTQGGLYVGGNAGTEPDEVLARFLDTKEFFHKTGGRQGYHFIISFAKGEADAKTVMAVAQEFCEKYLGDDFDHVFAVHTDRPHCHAHIIFNSVSRKDGHKYHYKKGDWAHDIQPITNAISEKYGLEPLVFDEESKGMSYAQWLAQNAGRPALRDVIRADIDYAIQHVHDYDMFLSEIRQMGYKIGRQGRLKNGEEYLSLHLPGQGSIRTSSLKSGYSVKEIKARIRHHDTIRSYDAMTDKMTQLAGEYLKPAYVGKNKTFRRLYQTVSYYRLPNPYAVPASRVRKDMCQIDKLISQCDYLKRHNIRSVAELEARLEKITASIEKVKTERATYYAIDRLGQYVTEEQREVIDRCRKLMAALERCNTDNAWEAIQDELELLQSQLPQKLIHNEENLQSAALFLKELRREKRMIEKILETEKSKEHFIVPAAAVDRKHFERR